MWVQHGRQQEEWERRQEEPREALEKERKKRHYKPSCFECCRKCCFFEGCCIKHPHRFGEEQVWVYPCALKYEASVPESIGAGRAHAGRSFVDLPAEVRNMIYELILMRNEPIEMHLNASAYVPDWLGARHQSRLSIFLACRQIYHEASSLFYAKNTFLVERRRCHCDFIIPNIPGMPFHALKHFVLRYPDDFGACQWDLAHMWTHFADDATAIMTKFSGLEVLELRLEEQPDVGETGYLHAGWEPLMDVLADATSNSPELQTRRMVRILKTLEQLTGKKMPECVRFSYERGKMEWWYCEFGQSGGKDTVDLARVNGAVAEMGAVRC